MLLQTHIFICSSFISIFSYKDFVVKPFHLLKNFFGSLLKLLHVFIANTKHHAIHRVMPYTSSLYKQCRTFPSNNAITSTFILPPLNWWWSCAWGYYLSNCVVMIFHIHTQSMNKKIHEKECNLICKKMLENDILFFKLSMRYCEQRSIFSRYTKLVQLESYLVNTSK